MIANLILVESPTKARTLSRFLSDKYRIEATGGHIRDLPENRFGVDVAAEFKPEYIIIPRQKKRVSELKKLAKETKNIILATDPDREGEAIAYHIWEILRNKDTKILREETPQKHLISQYPNISISPHRIVFHEITPQAVKEALQNPRSIDIKLVCAQQARRILDRLVGYKLSPLLWHKIQYGLSAGRVQSVALRLICEREEEIEKFKPREYWIIEAELIKKEKIKDKKESFTALLTYKDDKKIKINNKTEADAVLKDLEGVEYKVSEIVKKEAKRYPAPPFITSTLQQTAANRLGFSAKYTMKLAQDLYEEGLITYHRTDSVHLADSALKMARDYLLENYGQQYLPPTPRQYRVKSKVSQEAHEAVRPTDVRQISNLKNQISNLDAERLYKLIWQRFLASQAREAVFEEEVVKIGVKYIFEAKGSTIKFPGWLAIYGKDENDTEKALPQLSIDEILDLIQLLSQQKFTEPPARYTEATLIKTLEEHDIGRPSTYAPIISTILERNYIERTERKLYPTSLGRAVSKFLVENFPDIVDISFTAEMEEELDEIARGEREWVPMLAEFYKPFEKELLKVEKEAERVKVEEKTDEVCEVCGAPMVVKYGRFGKFLSCSKFPECKNKRPYLEKTDLLCPLCGGVIIIKKTRRGRPFFGCSNYPACNFASWSTPAKPVKIHYDARKTNYWS